MADPLVRWDLWTAGPRAVVLRARDRADALAAPSQPLEGFALAFSVLAGNVADAIAFALTLAEGDFEEIGIVRVLPAMPLPTVPLPEVARA